MARRIRTHLFPRLLLGGAFFVVLLSLVATPDGPAHAAGSFDSDTQYFFCNQLPASFGGPSGPAELKGNPACAGDFTPGATPDFGVNFTFPAGDQDFSSFAIFVSDEFNIAADAAIDDGTVIGGVRNSVTIGLINNPCDNTIFPEFILYEATTDTGNTVAALPQGTTDRFSNLVNDTAAPFFVADSDSPAILQYPSFLNVLLDPDLDYPGGPNGGLPPISPHARYAGLAKIPAAPSGEWAFLQLLVFEKSQLGAFTSDPDNATHPFARYGKNPGSTGWVYLLVNQDPTETTSAVTGITDFCPPVDSDVMFLGQVTDTSGTVNRFTNPAANGGIDGEGTQLLLLYGMSARDTDGDSLDNTIDTCAFVPNVEFTSGFDDDADTLVDEDPVDGVDNDGDTKTDEDGFDGLAEPPDITAGPDLDGGGNPAGDMLDSACDPAPATNLNFGDQDGDGFLNGGDNCPLTANATQTQAENTTTNILAAPDAGPKSDGIGDACEGVVHPNYNPSGAGSPAVADGAFIHDINTDAVCISSDPNADNDGDGWCSLVSGADPDDGNDSVTGAKNVDTDADTFENFKEIFMQTDPLEDCPQSDPGVVTDPARRHDAWPPDFDKNRTVNILDIVQLTPPVFNSSPPNPNYKQRKDLNADNVINILDIVRLTPPVFNTSCTP